MLKDISKEQERFLTDFGEILAKRIENPSFGDSENELIDQAALGFGRYLRAARLNAKLTPSQLAKKASVPKAEVYALERGLIIPEDIKVESLHGLAEALNENIRIFALMLERDISPLSTKEDVPERERTNQDWQAELRGDRGQEQQRKAHEDLADYLYTMVYNHLELKKEKSNPYILTTFTAPKLAALAKEYVQETLEELDHNNFTQLTEFKHDRPFLSWITDLVCRKIAQELRNSFPPNELPIHKMGPVEIFV